MEPEDGCLGGNNGNWTSADAKFNFIRTRGPLPKIKDAAWKSKREHELCPEFTILIWVIILVAPRPVLRPYCVANVNFDVKALLSLRPVTAITWTLYRLESHLLFFMKTVNMGFKKIPHNFLRWLPVREINSIKGAYIQPSFYAVGRALNLYRAHPHILFTRSLEDIVALLHQQVLSSIQRKVFFHPYVNLARSNDVAQWENR